MDSAFFTGHRNVQGIEDKVNNLIQLAKRQGIEHFYCGMALGTDMIAAKLLTKQNILWTAVVPFIGQENRWSESQKKEYTRLMLHAHHQIILYAEYTASSYHERNQIMIESSELCLAVYDGRSRGGTASVVRKCEKLQKPMFIYNPKENKIIKRKKA
jgi:uncharacterized phage-like protein YoqJ